jgi:hypothetical protein
MLVQDILSMPEALPHLGITLLNCASWSAWWFTRNVSRSVNSHIYKNNNVFFDILVIRLSYMAVQDILSMPEALPHLGITLLKCATWSARRLTRNVSRSVNSHNYKNNKCFFRYFGDTAELYGCPGYTIHAESIITPRYHTPEMCNMICSEAHEKCQQVCQ